MNSDLKNALVVSRLEDLIPDERHLADNALIRALDAKQITLDQGHCFNWLFVKQIKHGISPVFGTKTQNLYILWQGALFNEQNKQISNQ